MPDRIRGRPVNVETLKRLCKDLKLKRADLARIARLSMTTINLVFNGKGVDDSTIEKLCIALGTSRDELLSGGVVPIKTDEPLTMDGDNSAGNAKGQEDVASSRAASERPEIGIADVDDAPPSTSMAGDTPTKSPRAWKLVSAYARGHLSPPGLGFSGSRYDESPTPTQLPIGQPHPKRGWPVLRDRRVLTAGAFSLVAAALMMAFFIGQGHRSDLEGEAVRLARGKDKDAPIYCQDRRAADALRQAVMKGNADPTILNVAKRVRTPDDTFGLLVPAYFNPRLWKDWLDGWNKIFAAVDSKPDLARLDVIAIIDMEVEKNEAIRNDSKHIHKFNEAIQNAHRRGINVIARVDVVQSGPEAKSGDRGAGGVLDSERIKRKIDSLRSTIKRIDGIFLDNQPTDLKFAVPVKELKAFVIRTRDMKIVVSNPRRPCPKEYLLDDMHFANTEKKDITIQAYSDADPVLYDPPGWVGAYRPDKFGGIFWGLNGSTGLRDQLRYAAARHMGWIYLSDPATHDPGEYKTLTPYWDAEVREIKDLNEAIRTGVVPPGRTL